MSAEVFAQLFRQEHREIRDALLELVEAYSRRDTELARKLVGQVASLTGPHFRYEEEALYPPLEQIFGDEFIEMLLLDHDGAIGTVSS
jgi:hemerythrin-like domain-containing protein